MWTRNPKMKLNNNQEQRSNGKEQIMIYMGDLNGKGN